MWPSYQFLLSQKKETIFLSPRLLLLLLLGTKVSFGHHRPLELVCDGERRKVLIGGELSRKSPPPPPIPPKKKKENFSFFIPSLSLALLDGIRDRRVYRRRIRKLQRRKKKKNKPMTFYGQRRGGGHSTVHRRRGEGEIRPWLDFG